MNATFDTLAMTQRLEAAGIKREYAEAVASAIQDIAMKDVATKADVQDAVHTVTVRMGLIVGSVGALIVAILGALISIQ